MKNQIPYLIIGDGRMAKHLAQYFTLLEIKHITWSRQTDPTYSKLADAANNAEKILLAISDDAIEPFIQSHLIVFNKPFVHFSGGLITSLANGVHPLSTFTLELYDLETYQTIPFILDEYCPSFSKLFPELKNPNYVMKSELKNLYHALCVISGNFSCILWSKFFNELKNTFNLPAEVAFPYLRQITNNLIHSPETALTGPLARNDLKMISANLTALENDPYKSIYQAFLNLFKRSPHEHS
ncbi:MAG: DUF2520 domain-containing protein [Gammaproteobacteria bacterium]